MAIPTFDEFLLPLLRYYNDGKEHARSESYLAMAGVFKVSDDDYKQTYPNRSDTIFSDRVSWAITHLTQAGLIKRVRRGYFIISENGIELLSRNLQKIDASYLRQYPDYINFLSRGRISSEDITQTSSQKIEEKRTPIDLMEEGYKIIKTNIANDILSELKKSDPYFFQSLVIDLLIKMGYGVNINDATDGIKKGPDGGVDGIIKEDKLALDSIYIQAKRWENPVGIQEVDRFIGTLKRNHARKGVFITTSYFARDVKESIKNVDEKIALIDGEKLVELMIDHDLGVTIEKTYTIKKIDHDYFANDE